MNEALVALSRAGRLTRTILARDISSREHARKLWPLVTPAPPYRLVTYVSPTFDEDDNLLRRSHFRELPGKRNVDLKSRFDAEEAARQKMTSESDEHKAAKRLIANALQRRVDAGLAMPWAYSDPEATDFFLSGNLLLGAESIAVEHELRTGFGSKYRLDVAVMSGTIREKPLLLGGIEIELGHAFDGRKALIGKSQAFPLISIDVTGMSVADITEQWADRALTATTASAPDRRRKTFVYLHDLLYPLYLQLPQGLLSTKSHQFLVFANDVETLKLLNWVKELGQTLGLQENRQFSVSRVNAKSEQSAKMLRNAGEVVGADWEAINGKQCLRITMERPASILDQAGYFFHLALANLLLTKLDTLVGYKYTNGILNENPDEDIWTHDKWIADTKSHQLSRILPKRLAEPRSHIINFLDDLMRDEESDAGI